MTAPVRAYRALLRLLLPVSFTDAFAAELVSVFVQLDADARGQHGPLVGNLRSWLALAAELPGLMRLALDERRTFRTRRAHQATTRLEENMFDSLTQDIGFAVRSLRRSPGFAIVAVLTLALGIGANTAIFSVVNGVLLNPLALRDPSRLVAVSEVGQSSGPYEFGVTSPGSFSDWKNAAHTMDIAGFTSTQAVLVGSGEPQQIEGTISLGGLMTVLGVQPLLGRTLMVGDEDPAAPDVTVISYDAWQRLFGNDPGVIGRTITLGGKTTTIVGVMPAGFSYPEASNDFWWPWRTDAAFRNNRDQYMIAVVGRLRAGTSLDQARTEMATISARMKRDWPKYNQGNRIAVLPLRDTVVGDIRRQLLVLMGAVGFVLLITCANIGNLLLARASTRRREIAVRQALGAGRSRIARQLLTESMLLGAAGGGVGLVVGKSFLKLLLAAQATTNLPRASEITLDGRVLVFTLVVSLGTGLLFGSIPAWQLARGRSSDALREGTRGSAGNQWMRGALVVSELALAMVLLTGAGLLLRSFSLMTRVNPGVHTQNVLTFAIGRLKPRSTFLSSALDELGALPGVKSVAATSQLPITGRGIGAWFNRIDRPLPENVQPTGEAYRVVTLSYFATIGIPLKLGRLLTDADRREAPAVLVNEALVRKYYPHENPLGKPVYLGAPDDRLFDSAPIVGVVGDTHDAGLGVDALPTIYIPQAVMPGWPFFSFVVRTSSDPTTIAASARKIIHDLDPAVPIRRIRTLDDIMSDAVASARWSAMLLGAFAGVALVMAILGVFGVLSYVVSQRTRELGIRIALGASTSAVRRLVVTRGLSLVVVGLALGVVGAIGLTRFMTSLLYGVTPTDPTTLLGVAALLVSAALLAAYIPARRATKVDPITALRAE